jgi:hypothetical protein
MFPPKRVKVSRRSVRPGHRTDLIGCGTASARRYQAPAVYAGARHPNEGLSHEMDQLTGSGHGLDFCGEGPQEGCRVLRTHRSRPNRQRSECSPRGFAPLTPCMPLTSQPLAPQHASTRCLISGLLRIQIARKRNGAGCGDVRLGCWQFWIQTPLAPLGTADRRSSARSQRQHPVARGWEEVGHGRHPTRWEGRQDQRWEPGAARAGAGRGS